MIRVFMCCFFLVCRFAIPTVAFFHINLRLVLLAHRRLLLFVGVVWYSTSGSGNPLETNFQTPPPPQQTPHSKDEVPWATYKTDKATGDKVAYGSACHDCYEHWLQNHQDDEDDFAAHSERYRTDAEYKLKVDGSSKAKSGTVSKSWAPEAVERFVSHSIQVSRKFTILNDAELRSELKVARLNKGVIKGLPTAMVLVEFRVGDPSDAKRRKAAADGELEKVFVFPFDAASTYRTMEVASAAGTELTKKVMARVANTWSGQGDAALAKERKSLGSLHNVRESLDKLSGGFMVSLSEFASKAGRRKGSRDGASGGGVDDDMADEAEADQEDDDTKGGDDEFSGIAACSMVSPMKDRPLVPHFSSSASLRASPQPKPQAAFRARSSPRGATAAAPSTTKTSSGGGSDADSAEGSGIDDDAEEGDQGFCVGVDVANAPCACGTQQESPKLVSSNILGLGAPTCAC